MGKKTFLTKMLAETMATLLVIGGLTGCGASKAEGKAKEEITVTFMNQEQTLGTVTAAVESYLMQLHMKHMSRQMMPSSMAGLRHLHTLNQVRRIFQRIHLIKTLHSMVISEATALQRIQDTGI